MRSMFLSAKLGKSLTQICSGTDDRLKLNCKLEIAVHFKATNEQKIKCQQVKSN